MSDKSQIFFDFKVSPIETLTGGIYMQYRIEKDSIGEIKVPCDKLWGAQTQRSYENFKIGTEKIPIEMVRVFSRLKKAAAKVNLDLKQYPN